MVMDLRNNGGGSVSEANQLVGHLETGPTVQIRYSNSEWIHCAFGDNDPEVTCRPLAVWLIAPARLREIFAGAIQDYQSVLFLR